MSRTAETATHNNLDCDIDLTLPLDFVQEWIALTTKQRWTAHVKHYHGYNLNKSEAGTHSTPATQELKPSDGVLTFLETDMSVMPDIKGRQKTYLCVKITGLQLHVENGRLQLTVLDVKGNSSAEDVQDNIKCDVSDDDTVGQLGLINSSLQKVSGNSGSRTCEVTQTSNSLVDSCSAGARCHIYSSKTENDTVEKRTLDTGSHTDQPRNVCVTKKRRGRPHKTLNSAAVVIDDPSIANSGSDITSDQPVQNRVKGQPPTPARPYSLRGKKLPSSIFGDSESELEEAEDEEYHPTFRISAEKKYSQAKQHSREGDEGTYGDTDHRGHSKISNSLTESGDKTESGENFMKPVTQNSLQSSSSPPAKRKRRQPPHLVSEPESQTKQPTGKKRMKIDVAGLPAFTRRKRNRERKASCKYCRRKFCDFTGVTLHVKKFHAGEKAVDKYLQELKMLSVTKCSLCDRQFENRLQLQLHEDKAHFKTGEMQCDKCGKTFANMLLVKQHVRGVHLVKGQGHACSICSAKFKWAASLKTHMADVHLGIRELACNVCGKKFHRQAQLNRHSIIHGPEEAKLACELCGRKFWYPNNLQRHMAIVHGPQNETWHCAYCGKGFSRKESLHNHVEKIHYSIYPHNCSVCRAGFIRPALLEKHMATAHGQVGFQAPPGRRAHFKYNRSEHDELACGMCEDKFFYKAQLVQHVFQAHQDTFPFSCDICQQVFIERSFLILHRKRAHKLLPGPEDAKFDIEDVVIQQGISGLHLKTNAASQLMDRNSVEENSLPALGENSYIIKVENGDSTIQYVIQNPEGHHSAPSDAFVQDIAHLLLAAEQSSQGEHEDVQGSGAHGILPQTSILQGNIIHPATRIQQGGAVLNGSHIQTDSETSAQKKENGTVPPLAVNFETNCESQLPDHDVPQDLNLLTTSLDLAGDSNRFQTILVSGENVIHNFTPDSASGNGGVTHCHLSRTVADGNNTEYHFHSVNAEGCHVGTSSTDETVTNCHLNAEHAEHIANEFHINTTSAEGLNLITECHVNNARTESSVTEYHNVPSAEVTKQPSSVSYSTDFTSENFTGGTVYVTMDVPSTADIQQGTVEMTSTSDLQPMTLGDLSESVVLDASDVFGSAALNQQIIITTSSVDEGDGVIFSADLVQGE